MLENLLSALVGAVVGAVLAWLFDRRILRQTLEQGPKLDQAKELLQFLSRVLNREAPERFKDKPGELREAQFEWAKLNRELYLLNAPDDRRYQFDDRMTTYFESLRTFTTDAGRRTEVERQRNRAKEEARDLLRSLGLAVDWAAD